MVKSNIDTEFTKLLVPGNKENLLISLAIPVVVVIFALEYLRDYKSKDIKSKTEKQKKDKIFNKKLNSYLNKTIHNKLSAEILKNIDQQIEEIFKKRGNDIKVYLKNQIQKNFDSQPYNLPVRKRLFQRKLFRKSIPSSIKEVSKQVFGDPNDTLLQQVFYICLLWSYFWYPESDFWDSYIYTEQFRNLISGRVLILTCLLNACGSVLGIYIIFRILNSVVKLNPLENFYLTFLVTTFGFTVHKITYNYSFLVNLKDYKYNPQKFKNSIGRFEKINVKNQEVSEYKAANKKGATEYKEATEEGVNLALKAQNYNKQMEQDKKFRNEAYLLIISKGLDILEKYGIPISSLNRLLSNANKLVRNSSVGSNEGISKSAENSEDISKSIQTYEMGEVTTKPNQSMEFNKFGFLKVFRKLRGGAWVALQVPYRIDKRVRIKIKPSSSKFEKFKNSFRDRKNRLIINMGKLRKIIKRNRVEIIIAFTIALGIMFDLFGSPIPSHTPKDFMNYSSEPEVVRVIDSNRHSSQNIVPESKKSGFVQNEYSGSSLEELNDILNSPGVVNETISEKIQKSSNTVEQQQIKNSNSLKERVKMRKLNEVQTKKKCYSFAQMLQDHPEWKTDFENRELLTTNSETKNRSEIRIKNEDAKDHLDKK